ncbi:MAG: hypothetical protein AAFU67_07360 [Bacteroidota bacterium]
MRNYLPLVLCCLAYQSVVVSQHQLGWSLDPFAGINGASLQPAGTIDNPHNWDVNLINIHGFFANDYVYIANASTLGILRDFSQETTLEVEEQFGIWRVGDQGYAYDFLDNGRNHFGRGGIDVLGPSFSFRLGENTRLGLITRLRGMTSAADLDADFSYYPYDNRDFGAEIDVDEIYGAAAYWSEYGIHFSQAFPLDSDAELRIGGNFRYLVPVDGVSAYTPAGSVFTKVSNDTVFISNSAFDINFTNGLRGTPDEGTTAGNGYGADLGVQIAWYAMPEGGYRFSAGLSIIDLGWLRLHKTAESHFFGTPNQVSLASADYEFAEGREDLDLILNQLSFDFYRTPNNSLVADEFNIGLPTALSAQFSVRPIADMSVSAAYVGDLPGLKRAFTRGQQFTVATHFSRWWYGAGLTASAFDWRFVNIGLQVRVGPLTMGSDRLFGTLISTPRLQSGDFFIGLKLHDFGGGNKTNGKSRFKGRRGRGQEVRCYEF